MWGMYVGIDMAWKEGIKHLQVKGDSKILVDIIIEKCNINRNVPALIRCIRNLKNMSWQVQINYT